MIKTNYVHGLPLHNLRIYDLQYDIFYFQDEGSWSSYTESFKGFVQYL